MLKASISWYCTYVLYIQKWLFLEFVIAIMLLSREEFQLLHFKVTFQQHTGLARNSVSSRLFKSSAVRDAYWLFS